MKINRWIYLSTGVVGGTVLSVAAMPMSENPWYFLAATLLVWVLTHPLGILAYAVFLPPYLTGIATIEEAFLLSLPVAMGMGYLQWYVLLPRFIRRKVRESYEAHPIS